MITAIVLYDLPPEIDREACRQHFLKIAPDFLGVPGFIRKQFIHAVDGRRCRRLVYLEGPGCGEGILQRSVA